MTVGPILMALGVLWWARIPSTSTPWVFGTSNGTVLPPADYYRDLLPGHILFGLGIMMLVAPLTTALMTSIPKRNAGLGSAINNAISRVGPQLAGALIFVAIAASFYAGLHARVPSLDTSSEQVRQEIPPLNPPDPSVPANVQAAAKDASTHSFHVAMVLSAGLLVVGSGVNWFGIRNRGGGAVEAGLEAPPQPVRASGS
jgi:hypothetical protein